MGRSVLDDLGEEVTGIVAPVSICMFLTVVLVRLLNPEGKSDPNAVYFASSFYVEEEGDSTGEKLSGSIINALIFVGAVAVMTFVLVLLFKYGYTKVIYAYMGFAGFSIFFVLAGIIALKLLQKANVHLDIISFCYMLFNFAVVGAMTLFFLPAPLLMKQGYLIITGVAVAYVFTWIPEWTTWMLLVFMAIYDIVAVLMPGGPLKVLVELAQERDEQIPALVYEARPVRPEGSVHAERLAQLRGSEATLRQRGSNSALERQELQGLAAGAPGATMEPGLLNRTSADSANSSRGESPAEPLISPTRPLSCTAGSALPASTIATDGVVSLRPRSAPAPISRRCSSGAQDGPSSGLSSAPAHEELPPQRPQRVGPGLNISPEVAAELEAHPDEASMFGLPESIKLGLGDFIFYSVLVGRAAMYDMLTVFACYLAIIAGLGCTLLLLAMAHKALPALPISIALAVTFYFVSRFVLEPVLLPTTLQLVYF